MNKILFSKNSDNWKTPKKLYNFYMELNFFDPCPLYSKYDALKMDWQEKNFVNPPYSKIKEFVDKCIMEHRKGKLVVLLIPARVDTRYFRKLVEYGCEICFITGRLHFNNKGSAPFPSCLVTLTGKNTRCYWRDRENGE